MYRGSRLAASFLLVLTGLAATAIALLVLPPIVGASGSRWLTPIVLAFADPPLRRPRRASTAAATGAGTSRCSSPSSAAAWRSSGAISLLTGAHPFGADSANGLGLIAWSAGDLRPARHRRGPDPRPRPADADRAAAGPLRPELRGHAHPLTTAGAAGRRRNPRLEA